MARFFEDYVIDIKESVYKACWMLYRNNRIVVVVDEGRYVGVITFKEMSNSFMQPELTLNELVNRKGVFVYDDAPYNSAKIIFSDYQSIRDIPVIDNNKNVLDVLSRERVFWKHYYANAALPRMEYAYCIYNAAFEAKALGYKSISVLEFGVAGGNGLISCEFHAKEVEKLFGVKIEIYGFDSGVGLPNDNMGYKDMIHIWPGGSYKMNREKLENRLERAKLIIGRIEETAKDFVDNYNHAPIGCILVDVDRYSSTVPIMKMIEGNDESFLPRVQMYFDDVIDGYEFQGENLAIKEFNERNEYLKISPERGYLSTDYKKKIKMCHRFKHKKYNLQTMMFDGIELNQNDMEIHLACFSL
ncbi:MAG: CBS domain-containing protein [Lachnospiraceae bacterium]|nr:CBS domain-containing protein [Lachnospiraceae bacterium]